MKNIFIYFFILGFLCSCITKPKIIKTELTYVPFKTTENSIEQEQVISFIAPYKKIIDQEMNEVIAYSSHALVKDLPESNLGNMVCDLSLKHANKKLASMQKEPAQFVLLNNGGLRASLPQGEITRGKIFELLPFENELVVLTLSGQKTKELFDFVARSKGMPMAGIVLGLMDTVPITIKVSGEVFDIKKNYRIVTNDYLGAGGDKMRFFNNPLTYEIIGSKLRDAIIEELKIMNSESKKIEYKKDGRIFFEK